MTTNQLEISDDLKAFFEVLSERDIRSFFESMRQVEYKAIRNEDSLTQTHFRVKMLDEMEHLFLQLRTNK